MHREDESQLQAAFAELRRRQREQAPPFGAMRDRALREVAGLHCAKRVPALRWQWATASICVAAAAALWWVASGPEPRPPAPRTADSAQRVEEVLTAIEQELDLNAAISSAIFPTDILLTQNQTDLFP